MRSTYHRCTLVGQLTCDLQYHPRLCRSSSAFLMMPVHHLTVLSRDCKVSVHTWLWLYLLQYSFEVHERNIGDLTIIMKHANMPCGYYLKGHNHNVKLVRRLPHVFSYTAEKVPSKYSTFKHNNIKHNWNVTDTIIHHTESLYVDFKQLLTKPNKTTGK